MNAATAALLAARRHWRARRPAQSTVSSLRRLSRVVGMASHIIEESEVLPLLVQKTSACPFAARMAIGMNKSGNGHYVDLFDLAPAVSPEGLLVAFNDLPSLPTEEGDGVAPLCCQHVQQDDLGQLQATFDTGTRRIGGAMIMFRVDAEPKQRMQPNVDGLIVTVQGACCVCNQTVTLQQAGAPDNVQTMNRMRKNEVALAKVILQSDGKQPFEVMQLNTPLANEMMHQKLHKFQVLEYKKFATSSEEMESTTTPSKHVHDLLSTPRQVKRLKIENTDDIKESML